MFYQRISAEITAEAMDLLEQNLREVETNLSFTVNLSPEERSTLPKMGDRSVAFVDKALDLSLKHPDLVPRYLDVAELQRDLELARKLKRLLNILEPLTERVSDTYIAAGAEAFAAARNFYRSVKGAATAGVPGCDTIAAELGKRYHLRAGTTGVQNRRSGASEGS